LSTVIVEAPPRSPRHSSHAPEPDPKRGSVGESVTRGAVALLSTQPLTWGASLLTTVVVPRLLGADALGEVTIAMTIGTLAATAASLGISEYLVRRVAQNPRQVQRDAGIALMVQTVVAILTALGIVLVGPRFTSSLVDTRLLDLALITLIFTPAQTVLLSSFRGRELHTQYAWFNAASVVAVAVLGVLVLVVGGSVVGYAAAGGAAIALTTLAGWKLAGLRPTLPPLGGPLIRDSVEFIRGGFPFWTWNLTLSITGGIDRVILGIFVPASEVGWYAAAFRIIGIPLFIPTLIVTPLYPALSRSLTEPDAIRRTITQTLRVVLLLMVPMTAGIIVVAPAIPGLFGWPDDFANAVPLMTVLSLQLPLMAVDMVLGAVLLALGRQGLWVSTGVLSAALKIGLNFLAIPIFETTFGNGAVGASVITISTELVMFAGAIILIPKHFLDVRVAWDALRISIAGGAIVLVGTQLLPIALPLAIIGGAVAYVIVVVAVRAFTPEDLQLILSRLPLRKRSG